MALTRELVPWGPLLESGRADERLVHEDLYEARSARLVSVPEALNPSVRIALEQVGVTNLYAHQAQAIEAAFAGPTIVTTGTASGKSLCFQVPTLEVLTADRTARALYLYPTKALAQDQARALRAFGLHGVRPAIYDGDTPSEQRASAIRKLRQPDPHEPRHAARRRSCRTTRAGRRCSPTSRTSSSTRRTSTAACSARTSRTCCAGCGGCARSTAPSRSSCSRARPSRTRPRLARR